VNEPPTVVLALDLSLAGAGILVIPASWGGDWNRVVHHTFGESIAINAPESLRIGRCKRISDFIVDLAEKHAVTHSIIEGYAFATTHGNPHSVGELGGVVRNKLLEKLGIVSESVPTHSARKTLMGKAPTKPRGSSEKNFAKNQTRIFLTSVGMPPEWTMDEGDAFVVGNHKLAELGAFAFITAPPVEEKRPRRRKAA
jgi:hypothetical protein